MTNVAEHLISALEQAGVKRIYGLIGDSLNTIGQAVSNSSLRWIAVEHEEIAAFAAGAEAAATDRISVCAGTSGPGSLHLINGLYEAKANGSPVLALVTHIPSSRIGLGYFQETHPMQAFGDCSVYCETLSHSDQLPRMIYAAMQAAFTRRGPAVVIIPGDISASPCNTEAPRQLIYQRATAVPEATAVQAVAEALNRCQKVAIHCGTGCRKRFAPVLQLAEKLNAPMLWTLRSKDFVEVGNRLAVGATGLIGTGSADAALNGCDCLVLAGTDFPFIFNPLPNAPMIIQIDVDGSHIGRRRIVDMAIVGDVGKAAEMLLPLVKPKSDAFLNDALAAKQSSNRTLEDHLHQCRKQTLLRPECLTRAISDLAPDNATFIVDVGLNDVWANRYLQMKSGQKIIGSFRHGTMGAGLGQAIGLALAEPERPIIHLAGDGNLGMVLGNLLVLAHYKLPIKVIVYNNHKLGYIDLEAKMEGYPPFATDLPVPDFAGIADAMGLSSVRISRNDDLEDVLRQALGQSGPVVIDCSTDPSAIAWTDG